MNDDPIGTKTIWKFGKIHTREFVISHARGGVGRKPAFLMFHHAFQVTARPTKHFYVPCLQMEHADEGT